MITLLSLYTQQSLLLSVFLKIHATKGFSMIPHSTKPRPGIAAPNSIVEREINFRLHKGYALNQQRLQQKSIEFEQAAALLSQTLTNRALINEEGARPPVAGFAACRASCAVPRAARPGAPVARRSPCRSHSIAGGSTTARALSRRRQRGKHFSGGLPSTPGLRAFYFVIPRVVAESSNPEFRAFYRYFWMLRLRAA